MIASLDDFLEAGQKRQRDREDGQISMFDDVEEAIQPVYAARTPALPEWEESQLLAYEEGWLRSLASLARYERQLRLRHRNTQSLREFQDGEKISLGGMIFKTRLQTTRKAIVAFVTLEDVQDR
jgi:DNA polymerase-3 subunit alpha